MRAKQMRQNMPDAEFRLWCELRNRGLDGLRFRRQQPIGPYIVDFFCPAAKLIVEVDGEQHALGAHPAADMQRDAWLEAEGYTVVRFWTNEVMHELDAVCAAILAASRGEWRNERRNAGTSR
jgi:very-short-patch-repair endonuclease